MSEQEILLGAGTNEMELLTVWLNDQLFGINVAKVQSVQAFDPDSVTPVPESPDGVTGMMLYRERTIPLMDLESLLKISSQKRQSVREVVVVTEFNNTINGFKAHGVNRIFRLSWKEFVPINHFIGTNSFITGSVQADGHEIMVLDLEQVLETVFPGKMLESLSDETMKNGQAIHRNQLHLIFAEDSYIIRKNIIQMLKKVGFDKVTTFENGQETLSYCMERRETLASNGVLPILISDIEMPKMDGLTLCRKIKQDPHLNAMIIVLFSSLINDQMIRKCQQVEADYYVSKSDTSTLIEILDQCCTAQGKE